MKQTIKNRIINYVTTNYSLLDYEKFINGKTYMNHRCHINAVQESLDHNYKVILCVCVGNDEVFVHFINKDNKGNYIDNTLGWYGKCLYNYYIIREVDNKEYNYIWNLLMDTKNFLININSNWFERKLKFIKEDDI